MESKPTNPYDVVFICQGPCRHHTQFDTYDTCIPIWPTSGSDRFPQPICPVQPLPWANCFIDSSSLQFPVQFRVSTVERDYTAVLPMSFRELKRADWHIQTVLQDRANLFERIDDGSLEAIASVPLPPSPVSNRTASPAASRGSSIVDITVGESQPVSSATASATANHTPSQKSMSSQPDDDVSIIASDDDDRENGVTDDDIDMMLMFEDFIKDTGDVGCPVVNVWYDLSRVSKVNDPKYFLQEMNSVWK